MDGESAKQASQEKAPEETVPECGDLIQDQKVKARTKNSKHPRVRKQHFKCLRCEKFYTRSSNLIKHNYSVHGIKHFKCKRPSCDQSFRSKSHLSFHDSTDHCKERRQKSEDDLCPLCLASFASSYYVSKHIEAVHIKLKPFKCSKCEATFASNDHLVRHQKSVHEMLKTHKCSDCEKTFSQKYTLTEHFNIVHLERKNFVCGQCKISFGKLSNLKRHTLTVHTNFKKFKCPKCEKSFGHKHHFAAHIAKVPNLKVDFH